MQNKRHMQFAVFGDSPFWSIYIFQSKIEGQYCSYQGARILTPTFSSESEYSMIGNISLTADINYWHTLTKRGGYLKRRQGRINLGHFHCLALLLYPALWPLAYIRHRARFSQFYPRDLNGRDLLKATTVIILAAKSGTLLNLLWKPDGLGVDPNFTQCGQACRYSAQHLLKEADFWIHFTLIIIAIFIVLWGNVHCRLLQETRFVCNCLRSPH